MPSDSSTDLLIPREYALLLRNLLIALKTRDVRLRYSDARKTYDASEHRPRSCARVSEAHRDRQLHKYFSASSVNEQSSCMNSWKGRKNAKIEQGDIPAPVAPCAGNVINRDCLESC